MVYRRFTHEDAICAQEAICSLLAESFLQNFMIDLALAQTLAKDKTEELVKFIREGSAVVLGVWMDSNLIAICWLYTHHYFGELRLHLNKIVVDIDHRGMGIGKKLLELARQIAVQLKVNCIDLNVSESNRQALRFYQAAGFCTERRLLKLPIENSMKNKG